MDSLGNRILDRVEENVFSWFILVCLIILPLFLGLIIYAAWEDGKSPTITLKKSEWMVTHTRPITTTTYILSGKVLIPLTTTTEEPDQYTRIDK